MKTKIRLFSFLIMLLALAGCSKLTNANYAKLKTGMTSEQIEAILGSADSCDETLGFRACEWGTEEKYIRVKFLGDKAIALSKKGLG